MAPGMNPARKRLAEILAASRWPGTAVPAVPGGGDPELNTPFVWGSLASFQVPLPDRPWDVLTEVQSALELLGFEVAYSERYDLVLQRGAESLAVGLTLDPQAWGSGPGYTGPGYPHVPAGNAVVVFHLTLPKGEGS